MKLKYDFVVNQVAGQFVAVPSGAVGEFNGMIKLNDTGAFIFGLLGEETTAEEVIAKVAAEYSCDEATAAENVNAIIEQCKSADLLV